MDASKMGSLLKLTMDSYCNFGLLFVKKIPLDHMPLERNPENSQKERVKYE